MRKTVLFIAMSLDGYIADEKGGVDWLTGQDADEETIDVYSEFIENIDTVIMGCNTYKQIVKELSPNEWVYNDLTSYVITHNENFQRDNIRFCSEKPEKLVGRLLKEDGKDIWICGGANIAQQLIDKDMIDRYYISVIPTIMGKGKRLFGITDLVIKLKLIKTQSYNGITDLVYERR